MNEIWKPVSGYEGYYEVSSCGRVRSKERVVVRSDGVAQTRRSRMKKLTDTPDGYLIVKLSRDGVNRRMPVHALVAKEFVEGYRPGLEVNHIDYNRKNNSAENLEWVTHEENIQHTIKGHRHISQVRNMSGTANPNYGNRKLSQKYRSNHQLSKEKQSRPGTMNGRAHAVSMTDASGTEKCFGCMTECAEYLVSSGYTSVAAQYIAAKISKAASCGHTYLGCNFHFI